MVGLDGLEPTTSVLSGLRSNRLSYRPTGTTIIPIPPPRAIQRFAPPGQSDLELTGPSHRRYPESKRDETGSQLKPAKVTVDFWPRIPACSAIPPQRKGQPAHAVIAFDTAKRHCERSVATPSGPVARLAMCVRVRAIGLRPAMQLRATHDRTSPLHQQCVSQDPVEDRHPLSPAEHAKPARQLDRDAGRVLRENAAL